MNNYDRNSWGYRWQISRGLIIKVMEYCGKNSDSTCQSGWLKAFLWVYFPSIPTKSALLYRKLRAEHKSKLTTSVLTSPIQRPMAP